MDFAHRRFFGNNAKGAQNDGWLFEIIYEKIMVFVDKEKEMVSRKFDDLAQEIENRILPGI